MPDFSKATDEEILQFIADNRSLFANELAEDFPRQYWIALKNMRLFFIKRAHGFALCSKGRSEIGPFEAVSPQIEFLFVEPSSTRKGLGRQLVRDVQVKLEQQMTLEVICEGEERKIFFTKCGFKVVAHDEVGNRYLMIWKPE